jgi:ABC-type dipeptide/oligopeptide/nickel transport system permease subunit
MITKTKKRESMQKLTPIIILIIFAIAFYIMGKGMDNAVNMTKPKSEQANR